MKKYFLSLGLLATPIVASAATLNTILVTLKGLLDLLIPIIITLAVVYFFYGLAQYVTAKDESGKQEARDTMIYGIIALFVMVSVWGLVGVIGTTFGITSGGSVPLPVVNTGVSGSAANPFFGF